MTDVDYPQETPSSSPVPSWEQTPPSWEQTPPPWEKPPPAPPVIYNWVDITDEFTEACNGMCHIFNCYSISRKLQNHFIF